MPTASSFGPGDLSLNMGYPGQISHPEVVESIETLVKKTHDAGKISGTLGVTVEQTQFWHERGVQWDSQRRLPLSPCRSPLLSRRIPRLRHRLRNCGVLRTRIDPVRNIRHFRDGKKDS